MAKNNIALAGFDDIFNVGNQQNGEIVAEIALTELHAPDCHPFQVSDDEAMSRLAESVKRFGVREPGLARKRAEGGYELLCGNRRKRACQLAGLEKMPVIVREMDDDQAVVAMVDSNLFHRERILPSERAFAYKMKMEALNHNGVKADKLSCEIMAEQTGESVAQIFRFIRLTELVETLLDKVDVRGLALTTAVELSYLSFDEQHTVSECMDKYEMKPSLSQAVRLKKLKQATGNPGGGTLTPEAIESLLTEENNSPLGEHVGVVTFRKFFPPEYSKKQIEGVILGLLKDWQAAGKEVVT
jgi:ParB family chromosome partitioning protein